MVVTSVRDITQLNELKHELNKARSISQIHQHRYALEFEGKEQAIVFRSAKMEQIYEQIHHVAPFPTSILLSGPSGAGKEVVANLIHHLSNRKDKPFIKVNCAAIPEQLLEAELFGYEAGAFTGANRDGRIGLLELADQGTIMFDEIGEMPLSLQVKLLRSCRKNKCRELAARSKKSRYPYYFRHQPRPPGTDQRRKVPGGSLLPAAGGGNPHSFPCRTAGRYRSAG